MKLLESIWIGLIVKPHSFVSRLKEVDMDLNLMT